MEKIVKTHLIAKDLNELSKESFENFIEHRLEIFRNNIEEVTNKKIAQSEGILEKKELK